MCQINLLNWTVSLPSNACDMIAKLFFVCYFLTCAFSAITQLNFNFFVGFPNTLFYLHLLSLELLTYHESLHCFSHSHWIKVTLLQCYLMNFWTNTTMWVIVSVCATKATRAKHTMGPYIKWRTWSSDPPSKWHTGLLNDLMRMKKMWIAFMAFIVTRS